MFFNIYNGDIISEDSIPLKIDNRGFYYGDGFFETIRIVNGKPLYIQDHIDRINRSFHFLQMNSPFDIDENNLNSLILNLTKANSVFGGGRVRLTFFRNSEGFYTPEYDNCSYLLQCYPLETNSYFLNKHGLHLSLYTGNLKPTLPLYSLKTTNSLLYILAGIFARDNKCDDAFILNTNNNIIETTCANLFVVKGNTITTPGIDEGCVPGVMRHNIIKIIENKTDYSLKRGVIKNEDLIQADEVFITNVIKGIRWVVAYKEKRYYHDVASELSSLLIEEYS